MSRCKAKTKSGDQCRNNPISGTNYCYIKAHGATDVSILKRIFNYIRNHLIGVASLILGIVALVFYLHDKKIESTSGVLETDKTAKRKYIAVGGARFIIDSPDNIFLREGDQPIVLLRINNNRLFISFVIRDEQGDIIAELRDNEWKLNRNLYFDRNYNDQILEVRDNKGKVVLQVINFGEVIHFAGVFNCKNGKKFALMPDKQGGAIMEIRPQGVELEHTIEPICDYPSDKHLGSCPGFASLKKLSRIDSERGYRLGGSLEICK